MPMNEFPRGSAVKYHGPRSDFYGLTGTVIYEYPAQIAVEFIAGKKATFPKEHFSKVPKSVEPQRSTFMGRPFEDIAAVIHVMDEHCIGNAAQLARALSPKKAPKVRIEVYDSRNHDRLLGSIERPDDAFSRNTVEFHMAVMPPMRAFNFFDDDDDCPTLRITPERANFGVAFKPTDGGWTQQAYLTTRTDLEVLLMLPSFRLPGESEGEAARRRHG